MFDNAGDVTADGSNTYVYDGEGRICAVYDRTFGGLTQYIYDAEGTRVAKGTNTNLSAGCDILLRRVLGTQGGGKQQLVAAPAASLRPSAERCPVCDRGLLWPG